MTRLRSVATSLPPHRLDASATTDHLVRLFGTHLTAGRTLPAMVERSTIVQRYTAEPAGGLLEPRGISNSMAVYEAAALELASAACAAALERAAVSAAEIDVVVSVSCTGFLIPSLDVALAARLGLRRDVRRMPITELGCVAGVMALSQVHEYLAGHPHHRVLLVAVELPSVTFQPTDRSHDAIISSMLFGDGAAALVLDGDVTGPGLRVLATGSDLVPGSADVMGFDLRDGGFHIRLSKHVIPTVERELPAALDRFLARHETTREAIDFYLVHPGGARILDAVESLLGQPPGSLVDSREALAAVGNVSSASVFFILERFLERTPPSGRGLLLGFGPGFSMEFALLECA